MAQTPEEWLRQADYDMDTADYMFSGGRYFYAVFMCHLTSVRVLVEQIQLISRKGLNVIGDDVVK
jgi:HEPN domain-containing protein